MTPILNPPPIVSVNEEETFKPLYLEPFEENTKSLDNATNSSNTSQAWDESDESGKYGQIRIQMTIVDASSSEDYSADSEDAANHQDLSPSPPVEAAVPQTKLVLKKHLHNNHTLMSKIFRDNFLTI